MQRSNNNNLCLTGESCRCIKKMIGRDRKREGERDRERETYRYQWRVRTRKKWAYHISVLYAFIFLKREWEQIKIWES